MSPEVGVWRSTKCALSTRVAADLVGPRRLTVRVSPSLSRNRAEARQEPFSCCLVPISPYVPTVRGFLPLLMPSFSLRLEPSVDFCGPVARRAEEVERRRALLC